MYNMTCVSFTYSDGKISGFSVEGHTGLYEAGEDILCAAISSALYLVANTVTDCMNVNAEVEVKDGYMKLNVPQKDLQKCQEILSGLKRHLEQLSEQYPEGLKILRDF